MGIIPLILLGIGLSFDTFAVSISCGIMERDIRFWQAVRIALFFAFFQAIMPLLGWLIGISIREYIIQVDHWIAFTLLSLIGGKMILESFKKDEDKDFNPKNLKIIILMSFATTIDAFIIGITFAFLDVNLPLAAFIIGSVTFIAAMLGMLFGKSIGNALGKKMEIVGGLILFSLGVKILLEHML